MQFQHQGDGECALATIAMLTGKPLDTVRDDALSISELNRWSEVFKRKEKVYWGTIWKLLAKYRLPSLRKKIMRTRKKFRARYGGTVGLKGRGFISVDLVSSRHMVAFENGVVYDPDKEGPMPFEDWNRQLKDRALPGHIEVIERFKW